MTSFDRQMAQARRALTDLPKFAQEQMRANTPIDQGNARRNTVLQGTTVVANYPYAERLENNWSSQTKGQGIIAPTEQAIQQEVDRRMKGL
jgi:hypothetical protein